MTGRETINFRNATDRAELVKRIEAIRLQGAPERSRIDFNSVKDKYGGLRA